jgi:hypothetical protein
MFGTPQNLKELIELFSELAYYVSYLLTALALLFFFWGLAGMILNAGDASKLSNARTRMIWGLVALLVIFSLAGIIALLQNTFI